MFDARNFVLLKTIPLMEELESVVSLSTSSSEKILGSTGHTQSTRKRRAGANTIEYAIIAAGERGVLRVCRIQYEVSVIYVRCCFAECAS